MTRRVSLPRWGVVVAAALLFSSGVAWAANPFVDIAGNTHADNIDAIYNARITLGCSDAEHYCPSDVVRRDQMASFLARGLGLSSGAKKHFPVANGRGPGQVYCALAAASPRSFDSGPCRSSASTVDYTNDSGEFTSIAIGADGLPIIANFDVFNDKLRVTHCSNQACTGESANQGTSSVDAVGTVGQHTSIAIGADGLPIISYSDYGNGDLKVAHCVDVACEEPATITAVDTVGVVGEYTSIAIGAGDLPVISYRDVTNGDLKVARCANLACTGVAAINAVDTVGSVGWFTSIAIGTDSLPVISYYDATNADLKVARCANVFCSGAASLTTLDSEGAVGGFSSIAIGVDGRPVISYRDASNLDLKVVHCTNGCTGRVTTTVVDALGDVGQSSSIAIGTDGLPVISYYDSTDNDLRMAHCVDVACANPATITVVDSEGNVGLDSSIAIGTDGLPVISYRDSTNLHLKVARPPAA